MVSPPKASDSEAEAAPAGLVLVSTPIGNLGDMTVRGVETLRNAALILCEDTRMTARLLRHYGIDVPTAPLHDHNEAARVPSLVARLQAGERLALVSDAGTPLVSDPGYRLVRAAIAAGVRVSAVPGANAAITALTVSGLPPHPFLFAGFPPPKPGARRAWFSRLAETEAAGLRATLIFYEAPHRLLETLQDLEAAFGARPMAVARELTKRFETVLRGTAATLRAAFEAEAPRGEIVILVGPQEEETEDDFEDLLRAALRTQSLKDAVESVSAAVRAPRKTIYQRALQLAREDAGPAGESGRD